MHSYLNSPRIVLIYDNVPCFIFSSYNAWLMCYGFITMKNSKWVWSGNTTIINSRQPRGTARKSHYLSDTNRDPVFLISSYNAWSMFCGLPYAIMLMYPFFFIISRYNAWRMFCGLPYSYTAWLMFCEFIIINNVLLFLDIMLGGCSVDFHMLYILVLDQVA